jgi:hypothetical protein
MQSASSTVLAFEMVRELTQKKSTFRHLLGRNPCLRSSAPLCDQKTESMTSTQRNTRQKSPLFAFQPLIILDVVCIGQKRIEREERNCVEISVPRNRCMQARARDFGRDDRYRHPKCRNQTRKTSAEGQKDVHC